uniref:Putative LOC101239977 [Hydra vulgaris] n=1 Tax=Lepeophtheirus salmonis TaxID=72036 RepID=A0A0K2V1N9_LEPSM
MQEENFNPGCFLKEWESSFKNLFSVKSICTEEILKSRIKREEELKPNSLFLTRVYLDCRYRLLQEESHKMSARQAIMETAISMFHIHKEEGLLMKLD